jgi:hypothetical protein
VIPVIGHTGCFRTTSHPTTTTFEVDEPTNDDPRGHFNARSASWPPKVMSVVAVRIRLKG